MQPATAADPAPTPAKEIERLRAQLAQLEEEKRGIATYAQEVVAQRNRALDETAEARVEIRRLKESLNERLTVVQKRG